MNLEQLIRNSDIDVAGCISLAEHLGVSLECVIMNIYGNNKTNPEKTD